MTSENPSTKICLESLGLMLSNAPPRISSDDDKGPDSLQQSFVYVSDIGSDDSGSIVVLGKSSLDAIQTDSMTSFKQIRTKSLAMDCQSIISSLKPAEVEEKLAEVLRENLRLKETLEQNNRTMKKHLDILIARQNDLSQVHEAHKRKFAETKNLVSVLKNENNEYRRKIDEPNNQSTDQTTQTNENVEKEISTKSIKNSDCLAMMKLAEKCEQQTQEIAHMNRIIKSLKQQLESLFQNSFNPIKLDDLRSCLSSGENSTSSLRRQNFFESLNNYNGNLRALGACYAAQTSRYISIQECLQRCSEIITDKNDSVENSTESEKSLETKKRLELKEHRDRLIDEELSTIRERQEMIESQNKFQKICTDSITMLLEVENLRSEVERLEKLRNISSLNDSKLDEARSNLREDEKSLAEERQRLKIQFSEITKEREKIEVERLRLETVEKKIVEVNASLNEEVMTLQEKNEVLLQQLRIYEADFAAEKKLQNTMRLEKEELTEHIRQLQTENSVCMMEIFHLRTGE